MIDSITNSIYLYFVCKQSVCLGEETRLKLCIKGRQAKLASEIKDKINISCYTEYKAFGPSLIYNNDNVFVHLNQLNEN